MIIMRLLINKKDLAFLCEVYAIYALLAVNQQKGFSVIIGTKERLYW